MPNFLLQTLQRFFPTFTDDGAVAGVDAGVSAGVDAGAGTGVSAGVDAGAGTGVGAGIVGAGVVVGVVVPLSWLMLRLSLAERISEGVAVLISLSRSSIFFIRSCRIL